MSARSPRHPPRPTAARDGCSPRSWRSSPVRCGPCRARSLRFWRPGWKATSPTTRTSVPSSTVARHARIRAEELGAVCDLQAWLAQHSVDPTDPLAKGIAGGAGRRAGSEGSPLVDEFAVREYAALRHQSEPTARALMTDIADLEHRFPKLWAAVQALWLPVWQARTIVAACRELSRKPPPSSTPRWPRWWPGCRGAGS